MKPKNKQTLTDRKLEEYFNQRHLIYTFEPEPTKYKVKIPDYSFLNKQKSVLVECEELEKLPGDNIREGVSTSDLAKSLEPLRDKIYVASKQLKPYISKYDFCVVILGKKDGWSIELSNLYWAMFGDPVIRIPIDTSGKKRFKAIPDMKVKGYFRKNRPLTKEMWFPGEHLSGVGLIKTKNGFNYFKENLYDKYAEKNISCLSSLDEKLEETLKFFESDWEKYKNEIPKIYLNDQERVFQYVEIISNPFAKNPLPKDIFNGRHDKTVLPTIKHV